MAISNVIFADVSSLAIGSGTIESVTGAQISMPAEVRPIYTWGSSKPKLIVSTPSMGQGSFTYIACDGTNSSSVTSHSGTLNGSGTVTLTGHLFPTTGTAQTIICSGCSFQSQSVGMNTKGEMQVTVNFAWTSGTW